MGWVHIANVEEEFAKERGREDSSLMTDMTGNLCVRVIFVCGTHLNYANGGAQSSQAAHLWLVRKLVQFSMNCWYVKTKSYDRTIRTETGHY